MTLYHQILQMIAYRLFYVGRVSSRCGEFIRRINFQNPPTSLIGPLSRIVQADLPPISRFKIHVLRIEIDRAIVNRIEKKYFLTIIRFDII